MVVFFCNWHDAKLRHGVDMVSFLVPPEAVEHAEARNESRQKYGESLETDMVKFNEMFREISPENGDIFVELKTYEKRPPARGWHSHTEEYNQGPCAVRGYLARK